MFHIVLLAKEQFRKLQIFEEFPTEAPAPFDNFRVIDASTDRTTAEWAVERWYASEAVDGFWEIWKEASEQPRDRGRYTIMNEIRIALAEHTAAQQRLTAMLGAQVYTLHKRQQALGA